jgi:NAD(P)-dependent dehydrogenase (short-subunit alcohol dehydrogenase family)
MTDTVAKPFDPKGCIAVITGGGSGIGAACAKSLAANGAKKIVIADINMEGAKAIVASLPAGVGVLAKRCDVSSEADISRLISETESQVGPIDLFIANAGMMAPLREMGGVDIPKEDWDRMMGVNFM